MQVQENEVASVKDLLEYDRVMAAKERMYANALAIEQGRRARGPKQGLQARHSLSRRSR